MALYVTADLHLGNADTVDKPMEVFGRLWENHIERLKENWCVEENDTVIIAGDTSWAMDFKQLAPDFDFIEKLPGKKINLKGSFYLNFLVSILYSFFCVLFISFSCGNNIT